MSPLYNARYPGFDVLSQQEHWDEATRRLVLDRVNNVPPIRFFTSTEVETLQAVIDTVLPQDDRPPDRRIPIIHYIDEAQHQGRTAGYRYEGMPEDRTAWHRSLQGIDETSRALCGGQRYTDLGAEQRRQVLERIERGDAPGDVWQTLPSQVFYHAILMPAVVGAYYAHPYAWNEIGYGGPAYPRGYYALSHGAREAWEEKERA